MNLIIGGRLREGRLLCNHTITQAAKLLGISQGDLDLAESGFKNMNRAIPNQLIFNASQVYDISVDYIFGGNPDWELAEDVRRERDLLSHLSLLYLEEAIRTGKTQERLDKRLKEVEWSVAVLVSATQEIHARFARFMELNQDFDDRLGGNSLLKSIEHAEIVANAVICKLVKCKTLPFECINVNQRAKLTRVLGKTALKSFHPRLFNNRLFAGESWSVAHGYYCRNQKASFCQQGNDQFDCTIPEPFPSHG